LRRLSRYPDRLLRHLPNVLCLVRLALTPVCVWAIVRGEYLQALVVFFVAGWTDYLDGYLARRWSWKSEVGAYLDPLADKALMAGTYIALGVAALVPWWLVGLIFTRDAAILGGVALVHRKTGRRKFPPRLLGKLSTVLQIGAAVLVLSAAAGVVADVWREIAIWACAAGTTVSWADYLWVWWRMMRQKSEEVGP